MLILPAIDIMDAKPVRLYQGDFKQKEVVAQSVLKVAQKFEKEGAQFLHLVDLDGAKQGCLVNHKWILDVVENSNLLTQVGGGIRNMNDVDFYLQKGVTRVILGTSAMEDEVFLKEALAKYGERIVVGLDCKNEYVYGHGWLEGGKIHYVAFAKQLAALGVRYIVLTDIARDGTLQGPNLDMMQNLKKEVDLNIIASGGIKDIEDIKNLCDLDIYGAITGKALYHNTLSLRDAIKEGKQRNVK